MLSARVELAYWPDRRAELRHGDPVLVIGRLHRHEDGTTPSLAIRERPPSRSPFARHFEALSLRRSASARERLLVANATGTLGRAHLWSGALQMILAAVPWLAAGVVLLGEPVLSRLPGPAVR